MGNVQTGGQTVPPSIPPMLYLIGFSGLVQDVAGRRPA
jgi:hypothetical protein